MEQTLQLFPASLQPSSRALMSLAPADDSQESVYMVVGELNIRDLLKG